ncbi:hypothetical protein C7M51_04275 [Mixta intestinalis]|uniref:Uncharacterized protein n=1 Tax=Mixta intestinalis TaxID=1615494 RepID=A0A6P1Q6S3_9GAMM|nr:hypothetical protein C7M51_04275 [Mixta intestinalis]
MYVSNKFSYFSAVFLFLAIECEADTKVPTLWNFINDISASVKQMTVNNVMQSPLEFKLVKENPSVNFYQANALNLNDREKIESFDLRLSKEPEGTKPFLSFSWQGKCVSLGDIKQHYPQLTLTGVPRGRSENEMTSYTTPADKDRQTITFSFKAGKPDCLSRVVIRGR